MAGLWVSTLEKLFTRSSIRKGGFRNAHPCGEWHLATGLPLSGSGDVQASVVTGTTIRAGRFIAAADASDFLCLTIPLTEVLKLKDGEHDCEVILHAYAAQSGSGTADDNITVQADAVWEYGASSFTDTNIADVNSTVLGTSDDIRKSMEWNLTAAASAADRALITADTVLNIKLHPSEAVAANQYVNVWAPWLEIRRHVSIPDPT